MTFKGLVIDINKSTKIYLNLKGWENEVINNT